VNIRRGTHVSDERLIEVCVDRAATPGEESHFAQCDACASRRSRLEVLLHDMVDAAVSQADAAFPSERLAAQHARILQRIEHDGRPARVIAFPAAQPADARPLRNRPAARWIAGAAAAGLAIGLLAEHFTHDLRTFSRAARTTVARTVSRPSTGATLRAVNASVTDEEFLGEVENALHGPRLISLRPLNDLTPQ
jgi:hypothetical protein